MWAALQALQGNPRLRGGRVRTSLRFPGQRCREERACSVVPSWLPFPDTVEALRALGRRYRLAVISNIDDDLFADSARQLGIPFDAVITAEQARCYKPHQPSSRRPFGVLGRSQDR